MKAVISVLKKTLQPLEVSVSLVDFTTENRALSFTNGNNTQLDTQPVSVHVCERARV